MSGRIFAGFLVVLLLIAMPGAAEPTQVVQAEEILKKIELGQPVEYDCVIIVGDLNISDLRLPMLPARIEGGRRASDPSVFWLDTGMKSVQSPIKITNSILQDSCDLRGIWFEENVSFEGTNFVGASHLGWLRYDKIADFSGAKFKNSDDFRKIVFNQTANFKDSIFVQSANFDKTRFNQNANFYNSTFHQAISFRYASFSGECEFAQSKFGQDADFSGASFGRITWFSDAEFKQNAEFYTSRFKNDARFDRVIFNNETSFLGAEFLRDAYFIDSKFIGNILFINTIFYNPLSFSDCEFRSDAFFNEAKFNRYVSFSNVIFEDHSNFNDAIFLSNANFAHCRFFKEPSLDGTMFNGTISLFRTKYDTLNIRWSSIHDLAYDDTAYHLLIQNFNKLGFSDDARECQYSYRCKHREELFRQHKFDTWLFDLLAWASYGYGLRPVWPLGWAALFMLMGGLFFFLTGSVARSKASPSEKRLLALRKREEKPDGNVSIWEAILLSATYFTSGASSIISATPTEFVPVGRGRYVVVILRLLGWIFFVLFLSSLTRTV